MAGSILLRSNETSWGPAEIDFFASDNAIPSDNEFSRFSRPLMIFAATATLIIMTIGLFGNLLTIVALIKCPKVRNVAADFIISLCLADFLFCAIVLPFMAFRFIHGAWIHGEGFLCTFVPFVQYGNVGVSLLCIAMITINRYIMIAKNRYVAKIYTKKWIIAMVVFCWLFSYGFQLPTLFGVWGKFGYDKKLETCSILPDVHGRSSKTALFIIAFLIPCIIIIGCYSKIFWIVHKSEQRMRQHEKTQFEPSNNNHQTTSQNNNVVDNVQTRQPRELTRPKDQRDMKQKRQEWRITKMVLAIFLSFIACYLPITIIKVVDKNVNSPVLHVFGYIMIYLSACINPIIYVIMNKQYRQAYKTILLCNPARLLSFNQSSYNEKSKNIALKFNQTTNNVTMVSDLSDRSSSGSQSNSQPQPQHTQKAIMV